MVGADLRNLVNEAALSAARRDHDRVGRADFTDAMEKIVLGTARRIVLSEEDRRRTAYHESGHALLGMLEPGADPVRKVSIIPRGSALGVTFQSPDEDRYGYSVSYLRGRIVGALGGSAAEELIYGEGTTGAESDLQQATQVARQMVGRWGMSETIGRVSVLPGPSEQSLLFPGMDGATSEHTRELIDSEVKRITDECYDRALQTLSEHRDQLDNLASALLARETLDEPDAYQAAGIPQPIRRPRAPSLCSRIPTEPVVCQPPMRRPHGAPSVGHHGDRSRDHQRPPQPGLTREQSARARGECPAPGHCVLRAEGVEKAFHRGIWPRCRTVEVLKGASLMVCKGELVGLVGENGSGKSTLMQIVVGLLGRDSGEVEQPARLGYCPQLPVLWAKLTVDEHFELFARAYDLDEQNRDRAVDRAARGATVRPLPRLPGRGALRRHPPEAEPRPRADARARAAAPG